MKAVCVDLFSSIVSFWSFSAFHKIHLYICIRTCSLDASQVINSVYNRMLHSNVDNMTIVSVGGSMFFTFLCYCPDSRHNYVKQCSFIWKASVREITETPFPFLSSPKSSAGWFATTQVIFLLALPSPRAVTDRQVQCLSPFMITKLSEFSSLPLATTESSGSWASALLPISEPCL